MGALPDDLFIRLIFQPTGLFLFGMGIYGFSVFGRLDKEQRDQRQATKEQRRIDREFKRIQKRGKKQFKDILG